MGKGEGMIEGVIFDMDGLMFDTEPLWTVAYDEVLPKFGIPEVPPDMPDALRGSSGETTYRILRQFLGEDIDAPAIWAEEKAVVHRMLEQGVEKKPGLDELLAYLKEHDIPMAIASSSPAETIAMDLANAGVTEYFGYTISGEEVQRPKPDPQVFLVAAKKMGLDPAKTLVLEDSLNGVRAGAAGGFITVMVPDMIAPTDEIRAIYSRECASLYEVRDLLEAGEL